ncbi:hypothetical protein QDX81_08770 [Pseudomonas sp. CW003PS]|nr:hypothetical protein QDX81_08770 [Pseudomonas sp. CW003PS]
MLFPVDFPFSEKTRKSSLSLRTPEKPPENTKNLTGKCPAARVIAVSGGFSGFEIAAAFFNLAIKLGNELELLENLIEKCTKTRASQGL